MVILLGGLYVLGLNAMGYDRDEWVRVNDKIWRIAQKNAYQVPIDLVSANVSKIGVGIAAPPNSITRMQ